MSTTLGSELLTVAEAAEILKVSPVTISRWIRQGRLPAQRVGPRALRIHREDLASVVSPTQPAHDEPTPITNPDLLRLIEEARRTKIVVPPWTEEERRRELELNEEARQLLERMRARRGGKVLSPSWPIIQQARDERSEQI
jgi:excisionase family DNA binding protein